MYPSESDKAYGTFVRNFYKELSARNPEGVNDLCVIKGRRKGKLSKLVAYCGFYSSLLGKLLWRNYDLVYVHTITFPMPAVRIALALKRLPLVFNIHGDDLLPSTSFKKSLKAMAPSALRKALMIVSPSEYFKGILLKEFPQLQGRKIFVSPSGGVDKRFFKPSRPGREPGGLPVIGYVSRLSPGKGWDIYLKALKRLRENGVEFRALMAGGGEQTPQMEQMARELGLENVIDNLGALGQKELSEIYGRMDVFVFPTVRRAESLGLVGLEALAGGTPVIASNMAGPAGYISDGVNGYLFAPGNPDDLASRLTEFLNLSPQARRRMEEEAFRSALPYEATNVADKLCGQVENLLIHTVI